MVNQLVIGVILSFIIALGAIHLLEPLAIRLGLVDEPGGRKQHQGAIPLIGGIAIFLGFAFALLTLPISLQPFRSFIAGATLLVVVGVLDDFHELSTRARFGAQVLTGLVMTIVGGNILQNLGNLFFWGDIHLGYLAIPFTVFAVVGMINAVNMTDGSDGLAASICLVEFCMLAILAVHHQDFSAFFLLMLIISALIAFLPFNFRLFGISHAKVFMGDSGSMFLGFSLAWFAVLLSQGPSPAATPITILWIIAMPIMDTLRIMLKRIIQQRSPFSPDRNHLHHLLADLGLTPNQIVLVMVLLTATFGMYGIVAHYLGVSESILFISFVAWFVVYYAIFELLQKRRLQLQENIR